MIEDEDDDDDDDEVDDDDAEGMCPFLSPNGLSSSFLILH